MRLSALFLFLVLPLRALAAEPFATATVDEGNAVVGQQVHLTVNVFAPDFFTSPPQFVLFGLPNALVTLPEERAQNLVQTIDGVQYSGIRKRYAIVPEIAGIYAIPAIGIELGYSLDGRPIRATATTQPTSFVVREGTNPQGGATFAARNLHIEQVFDRDPTSLKVGDALLRTITVTAEDTQAIVMPPVELPETEGLRQYAKPPKLDDGIVIGRETASRRIETIVYTVAREGHFTLPGIDYPWFDVNAKTMTSSRLPPVAVKAVAAPARKSIAPDMQPESRQSPFQARRRIMTYVGLLLAGAGLIWAMRGLPGKAIRSMAVVRGHVIASRWYRLRRLRKTILSAEPPQVYAALQAWSRSEGFRTLNDWVTGRHPKITAEIVTLERQLYCAGDRDFDRRRVAASLQRPLPPARSVRSRYALPELNPGPLSEPPNFTRR